MRSLSLSPDGHFLVSNHPKKINLWDVEREKLIYTRDTKFRIEQVEFHPGGEYFISALAGFRKGASLIAWNTRDGTTLFKGGFSTRILSVAFSPDGTQFATGHVSNKIEIRSFPHNKLLREFFTAPYAPKHLTYSPNGERLLVTKDNSVDLWNVKTGERTFVLKHPTVRDAAFSPDGHKIATASANGTIRIWDASPTDEDK